VLDVRPFFIKYPGSETNKSFTWLTNSFENCLLIKAVEKSTQFEDDVVEEGGQEATQDPSYK